MPSVVGNLVVQNSNGSFNLGDFYNVSPKENTKAYNGSGASNVGFVLILLAVLARPIHLILTLQIKTKWVQPNLMFNFLYRKF